MKKAWKSFKEGIWTENVNVSNFILLNYKAYNGDEKFLEVPSLKTKKVWERSEALLKEELKKAESEVVVQEESIESGEDDGDLLSELLPTSSEETIINENLSKKIVEEEKKKQSKKIENSFFTTSMELSTDDMIDVDDDEVETYEDFLGEDKRLPIWSIILIILGVLITLGGIIYFLLTSFM